MKIENVNPIFADQDTIYHYTGASVALEKILYDRKLKFSPFNQTNDPREYKQIGFGASYWVTSEELEENINNTISYVAKSLQNNYKFVAFCKNINTKAKDNYIDLLGCCRPRMWSQYGDNNHGICLAFSLSEIEKNIKNQINHNSFYSRRVEYKKLPYTEIDKSTLFMKGNKIEKKDKKEYSKEFISKNKGELLFSKHEDYRDENEHRIIIFDPINNETFINIKRSIKAIILGERFHDVYIPRVKKYAKELDAIIKKLHWENGRLLLINPNEKFKH